MQPVTPITESTLVRTLVGATPACCYEVAAEVMSYPDWAHGIKAAEILSIDDEGRVRTARFEAEAIGRRTSYVLEYDYSDAPRSIRWSQVAGDITTRVDGAYTFVASVDDPDSTEVAYELSIDLAVPLPGFVKRRAEAKIVEAALVKFRDRAEKMSQDFS